MSLTCYASLDGASPGQIGPPAQIGLHASYFIVDTTSNAAVVLANGEHAGAVVALLTTPVASQNAILPTITAAIQAQEPGTPITSFIWVGL